MKLKYEKYWKKGKDFLKVDIPILAGAMTWLSDSKLVKAVSDAGGFGVLAAGNMPVELLEKEIKILREAGAKFAVNLIVIAPNYLEHLKKTVELGVKYIVFAGSFPRKEEVKIAKDGGAKVITFASTESIAQRMIDYGADALILEGSEAGGHIGHVSTIVLLQQVLFSFSDKILYL
jgi:enoyl-[acyl-carrier protein] reductase II